ncbi:O-antigen polysaccharide polymerase Wzy [Actinophytocola sp.]|uniref:O-antigen polysaccharide polymerase Wzy n=1 Tax=Actinophytocola sp. TaxID=1872138 RepID=UPI002D73A21A|nr:O-antigen polysaccharide polymerase Wzy [Actinophytocola sp.]HYQ63660.1 O-antigen polysaccharide polymerase Wzy [Actinophytocola sp.]
MDQPLTGDRLDLRPLSFVALVGFAGFVLVVPPPSDDIPVNAVAFWLAWMLCLALLAGRGLWRPSTAYLVLFGLFHGGLLLIAAVRDVDLFADRDIAWLYHSRVAEATRLVILGMTAFALCAELAAGRARRPAATTPSTVAAGPLADPRGSGIIGLVVEFTGIGIFTASVLGAGGFGLLNGGYRDFLAANESNELLGYGSLFIGMGAVIAINSGGRARVAGWLAFGAHAVVAFQVGGRGEVLFPLLAMLVVEARRGRPLRPLWTVLGVPFVLVLIALVRTTRLPDGIAAASTLWSAPLDAVAEMGCSLRPTAEVLDWHASGEPFRHGITLIAVPVRLVERLGGWHGGTAVLDDRLFNVEIMDRVGPVGGSPVAEGYHNGGLLGVVLLLGAIGLAVGWLERRPATLLGHSTVGVLLLPLLVQIRNSFAPVPAQLAVGVVLLLVVREVAKRPRDRRPISPAQPGRREDEAQSATPREAAAPARPAMARAAVLGAGDRQTS